MKKKIKVLTLMLLTASAAFGMEPLEEQEGFWVTQEELDDCKVVCTNVQSFLAVCPTHKLQNNKFFLLMPISQEQFSCVKEFFPVAKDLIRLHTRAHIYKKQVEAQPAFVFLVQKTQQEWQNIFVNLVQELKKEKYGFEWLIDFANIADFLGCENLLDAACKALAQKLCTQENIDRFLTDEKFRSIILGLNEELNIW